MNHGVILIGLILPKLLRQSCYIVSCYRNCSESVIILYSCD